MDTSDIRKGLKFMVDGQPHTVIDFQFIKPGKGQPFYRCKIRNMVTRMVLDRTYKAGERLEHANVEERSMRYVYQEGSDFVFEEAATSEQLTVSGDAIGDDAKWLSGGMSIDVTLFEGRPLEISVPPCVVLQIVRSEPGLHGGATKPATVSTGAVVNVPLFVQEGEWIKIDTKEGRYLQRVGAPE